MSADDLYGDDGHIPGDFRRNTLDQPLVKAPDSKRTLAYDRFSNWPFDNYDGIDPIYAQRGQWAHTLTERINLGMPIDNEFVAEGVELGIPLDVQGEITNGYRRFRQAHGLEVVAVEAKAVCDEFRTAGTIDRVDRHDGRLVVADVKTSASVDRLGYACQLVYGAHSVPYDVDTDERGEWPDEVDQDVAYVYHYPLTRRLKGELVEWQLVKVDLTAAAAHARELLCLRHPDKAAVAGMFIPADTPATNTATPPTLDELRARIQQPPWTDADRQALAHQMTMEGVDRTDAEQVAAAIDRYHFHDIRTEPQPRPTPAPEPAPTLNTEPDEGGPASDKAVEALQARYGALEDKAAVGAWATQAQRAGVTFTMLAKFNQPRTLRRLRCMTVAVMLAEGGFDSDCLRGVLRHVIGDTADMAAFPAGALLGSLTADEAALAVEVAGAVTEGTTAMAVLPDGRIEFEVAA